MKALDEAIQDEYDIATQVSDEEWEAIRPTKLERRNYLLERVKVKCRDSVEPVAHRKLCCIVSCMKQKSMSCCILHRSI